MARPAGPDLLGTVFLLTGLAWAAPGVAQGVPADSGGVPDPTGAASVPSAESPPDSSSLGVPPSLASWADRTWDLLADRSAADAGAFSRDGLLLRFHEDIDAEYALDHISSRFDVWEDGAWAARTDGVRYWSGSIDHLQMTDGAQVKVRVPLGRAWAFGLRYDRESAPPLERNLLRVRIGREPARGFGAWLGASLQPVKPDRDLELGIGWAGEGTRVQVALVALDGFSNLIYNGIGVYEGFAPRAVDYDGLSLGVRASAAVATPGAVRLSLHAGVQLPTTLRVYEQEAPDRGFRQEEDFQMVGVLADIPLLPALEVGGLATLVRTERSREPLPDGEPEDRFRLYESTTRLGLLARARPTSSLQLKAWAAREWRPQRRWDTGTPEEALDYLDRGWIGSIGLHHRTTRHLRLRGAWDFDVREVPRGDGRLPGRESLARNNHRFRLEGAWVLESRFELALGVRLDGDGDRYLDRGPFDGGHGRLIIHW